MNKPRPSFDWETLEREVQERRRAAQTPRPKRGFTVYDYAERYGLTLKQATLRIRALRKQGLIHRVGMLNRLYDNGSGCTHLAVYDLVTKP